MNATRINRGSVFELAIESLAFGGKGVARLNDFVIFVNGALPGQVVQAEIRKRKQNFAEARLLKVVQQTPSVAKPLCDHFGECGGCLLQNLNYQAQLTSKHEQVVDSLFRLGKLEPTVVQPTLPSPDIYFYRNKMEYSFARQRWLSQQEIDRAVETDRDGLFLGLHARGFYEKVVDIGRCHLLSKRSNQILRVVREIARQSNLPAYSTHNHSGFWRFLVIREGKNTDEVMVNIITARHDTEIMKEIKNRLLQQLSNISSLFNGITTSKSSVAFCEKEILLAGNDTIRERIVNHEFEISPNSFFQTNTKQAENLYNIVLEYAELAGTETVFDLYTGAGTIAIHLADRAEQVVGFEAVASAVQNAHRNVEINNISNCQFVQMDLKDLLAKAQSVVQTHNQPDVIVVDPPRAGMHPKTVQALLKLNPDRIVHVSCNPTTLARDLAILCADRYRLTNVQPVDMFPHTAHIEIVVQLQRR